MEQSNWRWVISMLTVIAIVLLYIIKGVFWVVNKLSEQIIKVSDNGLKELNQSTEEPAK